MSLSTPKVTVAEAAKLLNVRPETVHSLRKQGEIWSTRDFNDKKQFLVDPNEVEQVLADKKSEREALRSDTDLKLRQTRSDLSIARKEMKRLEADNLQLKKMLSDQADLMEMMVKEVRKLL